jgi:hypothetical protein
MQAMFNMIEIRFSVEKRRVVGHMASSLLRKEYLYCFHVSVT